MEITKLKYTKKGSNGEVYICRIWYIVETKKIIFLDCECWNFNNRQLKKEGKGFMTRHTANPCKHLKPSVEALFKQGYEIEKKFSNEGEETCSVKLRKAVIMACKGQCNRSDCTETENLEIHRQIPKTHGGKYSLMNCVALCRKHHQEVTYQPWHKK